MLPPGSHLSFQDVNRTWLEPLRRPDPPCSIYPTEAHGRWRQERNADDDTKLWLVLMPTDPGSGRIFIHAALLELVDLPTRKFSHFVSQVGNKSWKSIRNIDGTSCVIVAKSKRGYAAIA